MFFLEAKFMLLFLKNNLRGENCNTVPHADAKYSAEKNNQPFKAWSSMCLKANSECPTEFAYLNSGCMGWVADTHQTRCEKHSFRSGSKRPGTIYLYSTNLSFLTCKMMTEFHTVFVRINPDHHYRSS